MAPAEAAAAVPFSPRTTVNVPGETLVTIMVSVPLTKMNGVDGKPATLATGMDVTTLLIALVRVVLWADMVTVGVMYPGADPLQLVISSDHPPE